MIVGWLNYFFQLMLYSIDNIIIYFRNRTDFLKLLVDLENILIIVIEIDQQSQHDSCINYAM
jgi:hypothetical protein